MPSNREIELLHRLNKRKNQKISSARRSDGYVYPSGNKRRSEIRYKDGIPEPNPHRANSTVDIVPYSPHTLAVESVLSAAAEGEHPALALGAALSAPVLSKSLLKAYPRMAYKIGPKDYKGAEKEFRKGMDFTRKYYSNPETQRYIPVEDMSRGFDMQLLKTRLQKAKRNDVFGGIETPIESSHKAWYRPGSMRVNEVGYAGLAPGSDKLYLSPSQVQSRFFKYLYSDKNMRVKQAQKSFGSHEMDHFLRSDPERAVFGRTLTTTDREKATIRRGLGRRMGKMFSKNIDDVTSTEDYKYFSEPGEIMARITELRGSQDISTPMAGFWRNNSVKKYFGKHRAYGELRQVLDEDTIVDLFNAR